MSDAPTDEPRWKHDGVRVIKGDRLDSNTAQTPGMFRQAAINHARVGAQKIWAGTVTIEPTPRPACTTTARWRASSSSSAARRGCAGASGWNSSPRPSRATSSSCRPTCRIRRSTPIPDAPLECVLVRSDNEAVVVNITDVEPVERPRKSTGSIRSTAIPTRTGTRLEPASRIGDKRDHMTADAAERQFLPRRGDPTDGRH